MGSLLVVVFDPAIDGLSGLRKAPEVMLPDALLLQIAEEALDHAVLLRRIGCDELLGEPIVPKSRSEAAALQRRDRCRFLRQAPDPWA